MLWTPDCPQIACWRAVPLARVEGGFNCVGMSIGRAHTKALYHKLPKVLRHITQISKQEHKTFLAPFTNQQPLPTTTFLLLLPTCQCQLPINQSSHCQLPPNPQCQEKSQAPCLVLFECELLDISELLQIFLQASSTKPFVSHHLEQHNYLKLWSLRTWTLTYVTTPTYCPLLMQHQFSVNYWNIVHITEILYIIVILYQKIFDFQLAKDFLGHPWKQACLCLSLVYFDNLPTVIWQ